MTSELDRLRNQFIDDIKCGRYEEAARTLAERDELLLAELITGAQIARMFGVTQPAVSNWIARHEDFPAPRTGHDRTARYSRTEVAQWWATRHPQLIELLKEAL